MAFQKSSLVASGHSPRWLSNRTYSICVYMYIYIYIHTLIDK